MFQPKLIVTDLDGTALTNAKTVSPATSAAFQRCHNKGIPIAIATARYLGGTKPYVDALSADYQILTDGTLVFHNESLLYANVMDINTTNALIAELKRCDYCSHIAIPTTEGLYRYPEGLALFQDNFMDHMLPTAGGDTTGIHFDLEEPFPLPAAKLVVELPSPEEAERIASLTGTHQFHYRGENRYTFYHKTASKLDAIKHLADSLSISLADILVFGDDINDIEMIRECGLGIAMSNALAQVKEAADEITDSNENDGIAKKLAEYY